MPTYTVHEAKTHLSKLIERAERGEEVIIARGDKPVVQITALENKPKPRREPGAFAGQIVIHDSFFDPMTEEELALWEGGYEDDALRGPFQKPST
jgi:prevent-host-death family protein